MTAENCWCTLQSLRLICPTRVVRPNWKAECVERRPLRLEGGKDCKVLPILTWVGVSPPGYPVHLAKLSFFHFSFTAVVRQFLKLWTRSNPNTNSALRVREIRTE